MLKLKHMITELGEKKEIIKYVCETLDCNVTSIKRSDVVKKRKINSWGVSS